MLISNTFPWGKRQSEAALFQGSQLGKQVSSLFRTCGIKCAKSAPFKQVAGQFNFGVRKSRFTVVYMENNTIINKE